MEPIGDWGDHNHYDLMLSTDRTTPDGCVDVIRSYIAQRT